MANVKFAKSTQANAPVLTGQVGSLVALLDALLVNGFTGYTAPGWTKAFSGTNRAAYRMNPTSNTGFYLDVNDAAAGTGGAREAQMRGYETMTAVGTGAMDFPTVSQSSFGIICRKSNTADAVARPWFFVGDDSAFYLYVDTGDWTAPSSAFGFHFGDFNSYLPGDPYRCCIIGRSAQNDGNRAVENLGAIPSMYSGILSPASGHYIARSQTGVGGSTQCAKNTLPYANGASPRSAAGSANAMIPYPNPADQSLLMAPFWMVHNSSIRGTLKGFWAPMHNRPVGHWDTFSGTGPLAGKDFVGIWTNFDESSQVSNGQVMIETSNTWG